MLTEIHEEMVKMKYSKKMSRNGKENQSTEWVLDSEDEYDNEAVALQEQLPEIDKFLPSEYVGVAYQDAWYPGCVKRIINGESAIVQFLAPCRAPGHFKWPQRQDKQTVEKKFILQHICIPECVNSGRQCFLRNLKK